MFSMVAKSTRGFCSLFYMLSHPSQAPSRSTLIATDFSRHREHVNFFSWTHKNEHLDSRKLLQVFIFVSPSVHFAATPMRKKRHRLRKQMTLRSGKNDTAMAMTKRKERETKSRFSASANMTRLFLRQKLCGME